ncbi:hypothetical protein L6164_033928 [Bauhinia variegata]|nr:hypothetical protein L6164_033928 [Bauhinia variegata]
MLLALRQRHNKPLSDPIPPKIFLDSLAIPLFNVADGQDELPAIWDVKLMISNVMNATDINIKQLEATVLYKHYEALLSMFTLIKPQVFPVVEAKENKMVDLKFSSRGWEKNQPDAVVDAMAKDRKKGVIRFDMLMRVNGDVEFQGRAIPFLMSPNCTDLVVQFPSSTEPGQAPTLIHGNHTECLGVSKWGRIKS